MPCNACGDVQLTPLLAMGDVPIAHRFRADASTDDEYRHPMTIQLCEACGLVQIVDPIPPEELYKEFNFCFSSWKPQPHMTAEAELLAQRSGRGGALLEIGSNDGAFLHTLLGAGFTDVSGVEPNPVACGHARETGATIYEGFFGDALAEQILAERGPLAAIASRQTIEHITDLRGLMRNAQRLLRPGGTLLIEVPDCEVGFAYGDCSGLWEEHVNYFGEAVLCSFLERHGFEVELVDRYPFSGGALLVVARRAEGPVTSDRVADLERWRELARGFAGKVETFKARCLASLRAERDAGRPTLLYGSGCRANMLLNGLGLHDYLDGIVDDQEEKQGLYMPGSSLRVQASDALYERIGACFLSVNAENEESVTARHAEFTRRGGRFYSLNSPSPLLEKLGATS